MTDKTTISARITYLEMTVRSSIAVPTPSGLRLAVLRASDMPLHFYRYLYEQVGRDHNWMMRRLQSDAEVTAAIHADTAEIHVLYADGSPAGFFELDLRNRPESVTLLYFGLVPDFQGRGLARFFLQEAIAAAWAHSPQKLALQTNTLDSPRALQLYQKMGFQPVGWSEEEIVPWS